MIVVLLPDSTTSADLQPADILFPSIDSFQTYADVSGHSGASPVAYITAEFADDLFPADNLFVVGGDAQPNDRAESYSNGPLHTGSFAFFLRAYPLSDLVSNLFTFCIP